MRLCHLDKSLLLLVTLLPMTAALDAAAQADYPVKTVRIVAPFPPGGSVDTVSRLIAARLTESYGQTFVVDNRGGASGNIGSELVAKSVGDGYTLLVNTMPLVVNQFLYSQVPYDALRDFAPVSLLTGTPAVLAVHPSLPVNHVRGLIELAKSRVGKLDYGTAGVGTNSHIAGELLNYLAQTNISAVHFKGGGPATIASVSGEISINFNTLPDSLSYVRSGRLRAIGVSSAKRAVQLPAVPTIAETLPGYEFTTWQGILAPRATPRPIVASLGERIKKSLSTAEGTKRFNDAGLDVIASTPDEFATHLKSEVEKWGRVIRERKLKAE